LIHFVLENGVYCTTGGQPIPGAGKINFTALAKGAGFRQVCEFEKLEDLESSIETIMNQTGPTFVCLKIQPITERPTLGVPVHVEAAYLSSRLRKAVSTAFDCTLR